MAVPSSARTHLVLACSQIAIVTYICHRADIWRSTLTGEQFPGHLGPSIFIAGIGLTALCNDWTWRKRCVVEGRLSVAAAATYVVGEACARVFAKGFGGIEDHYMKHGLHAWMCVVIGLCGVAFLLAPRLDPASGEKLRRAPHLWFAVNWCWFIWAHKQPNDFGVAMHAATAAWVALGAYLRIHVPNPKESGACYVFAAYTFFGGQTGLTLTAAADGVDVGAYILVWHCLAMVFILFYLKLFLVGGAAAPAASDYAPVALDDNRGGDVELARPKRSST